MDHALDNAIDKLVSIGRDKLQFKTIHEEEDQLQILIQQSCDRDPIIQTFQKQRQSRNHIFESVTGFLAFLNSSHCAIAVGGAANDSVSALALKPGVVFTASSTNVVADIEYGARIPQRAILKLDSTEEFAALLQLIGEGGPKDDDNDEPEGLSQRELWRMLISKLDGCIDSGLLLAIGSLEMSADAESKSKISLAGLRDRVSTSAVRITFGEGNTQTADLRLDWEWKGRIWNAFDREFTVPLRLEINNDLGLRFIFHARRLQKVLIDARAALTETIAEGLPEHFQCYQAVL